MQTVVERLDSIAGVDRQEWDRLGPGDVLGSWGWLRTVEETGLFSKPVYFIARSNGMLVAAAPCRREVSRGMDRLIYGRYTRLARALRLGVWPALMCGSPTGLSQHIRVDPAASPRQREQWTMLLIESMQRFAKQQAMTLCFRNLIDGEQMFSPLLEQLGFMRAAEMPTTIMDVRWTSFAEYRRDLMRTHPGTSRNISREIKRARDGGIVFRKLCELGDEGGKLHAILENHCQRLNQTSFAFGPAFFEAARRNLGDKIIVHVAEDKDGPVAVSIGIRGDDTLFLTICGNDVARGHKSHVYFNNSYNVPIEDAILSGVRRIYCGKLLYDVKLRRGFRMMGLNSYLWIPNPVRAALLGRLIGFQRARIQKMMHSDQPEEKNEAAT